jgi:hypothetical protein
MLGCFRTLRIKPWQIVIAGSVFAVLTALNALEPKLAWAVAFIALVGLLSLLLPKKR